MHVYRYYGVHREAIWYQLESIATTITLPFKIARLSAEPPLVALPMPVHGVHLDEVTDTWGAARSEGRTHEGVDIFAGRGTPVFSVSPGYVVRSGENQLGGLFVITIGPGGVRYYYAHLDTIATGMEMGAPVHADTVIGYVGNTGNASGTPPHLHFGIYADGAENPYPLLRDRSAF